MQDTLLLKLNNMKYLETERLVLKEINICDLNSVFDYMSDIDNTKYLYNGVHKSINDTIDFINNSAHNNIDLLGIYLKNDNKLIGHIALLFNIDNNLLWVLNKNYQKKGYAYEAAKTYINYIFNSYDLNYINASADINNHSSIKLIEKLNMIKVDICERIYPDDRLNSQEVCYKLKRC